MQMSTFLITFAVFMFTWTVIPLLRHEAWWIRGFEFPRTQLAVLSIAGALASALFVDTLSWKSLLAVGLFIFCALFHIRYIWPYTAIHPKQVKRAKSANPATEIGIIVGNVLMTNRQTDAFLRIIETKDPDLVLALETDQYWQDALDTLNERYPHAVKYPLDNLYGIHLYSKFELIDPKLLFLVEDGVPSIHTTVVLHSGDTIDLRCLHPAPPSPTENETSIERDAELLTVAQTFDATKQSVIVAGDLNDVAWSETTRLFQRTSQLLDPRVGRGMFSTFHAKLPFLRWPLDHIFHSADFELAALERLPTFGSDHFPIYAKLQLHAAPPPEHAHPEATEDDEKRVVEKVNKADVDENAVQELDASSRP